MKAKFGLFASVIFIVFSLFAAWHGGNGAAPAMQSTDILALQPGSTIYGMNLALIGKEGAPVLEKVLADGVSKNYLFIWPLNNGWGFVGMDPNQQRFFCHMKEIIGNGNFSTPKNVSELTTMLTNNGWKAVPGSTLPIGLQQAITSAANPSWVTIMMHSPSIMLITPIGPLNNMNDPDWTPIYMIAPKVDA